MTATAAPPTETTFDAARSEAFAERLFGQINGAAIVIMASIGHRTGLFDAMSGMDPATSQQIAEQARLDERYVREWLGAMVTGRVVEYDPATKTYALPPEHAAFLTRDAVPDNLAAAAQWVSVLGAVEDRIVDCFHQGGGVPYSEFKRFHEVMAEESAQTVVAPLLDEILPFADGLPERLEEGIDVLDVGCGAGRALIQMARSFPNSRFTGFDISEDAVRMARAGAAAAGLRNVRFEVRDVAEARMGEYDLVTGFDVVHDQAAPQKVLDAIHAALRLGGTLLLQDIHASSHVENNLDHPFGAFLYTISTMHCMTVSLAREGAGLGTCWGRELATEMLGKAGFGDVAIHTRDADPQSCFYVSRKA